MKSTCIFFQAPAELPYVIQLYDEYKNTSHVKIVVVNVYSNFEFIKSLSLADVEIIFCECPLIHKRHIVFISSFKKYIHKFWDAHLDVISKGDVFFFSASFDWVTAYFVKNLSSKEGVKVHYAGFNTTEVILKESYENGIVNKGLSLKDYVLLCVLKAITGIWFDFLKKLPCISFPYFKYGIDFKPILLQTDAISPYKYDIPGATENCVLLFTTTWVYESEDVLIHVDRRVCEIIESIKSRGYQVVAKGHPRFGIAKCIEHTVDIVLPNYVPAEFINTRNIKLIIGINSAAIIYYAVHTDVKTVSLLKMVDGISKELVEENVHLMKKMCGDMMLIPDSLQDLWNLLLK